jgi:CheY-like chemotaxis protein
LLTPRPVQHDGAAAPDGRLDSATETEDDMARLLVLEDDVDFRNALRKMLEKAGYAVDVAANGRQGVEFFKDTPPDLVITDMQMPSQGGVKTIDIIRGVAPEVPIIAMSGSTKGELEAAMVNGANMRLSKPFDLDDLLSAVSMLLEEGDDE